MSNIKLTLSLFVLSFCLLTTLKADAKYYYGLSSFKVDRVVYTHTLKQYNSKDGFFEFKKQKIGEGIGRDLRYFFSEDQKYLLVYLTKRRKVSDELIVYTTADFNEIYRLKIGKFSNKKDQAGFPILYPPIFDNDNTHFFVQTQVKNKSSKIQSLRLDNGTIKFSFTIDKGVEIKGKSKDGNLLYAVKEGSGIGGVPIIFQDIKIYDTKTGSILNSFQMEKSYKFGRKVFSFLDNTFSVIVSIHKLKGIFKYKLLVLNTTTGKVIQDFDAGGAKPIHVTDQMDAAISYLLLAKSGKLEVVKFESNQINELLKYDGSFMPKNLIINKNKSKFIIVGRVEMVLLDKNDIANSRTMKLPFDIGSGFFSSNDEVVYIKEGRGSEIGILDFSNGKLINTAGTGRKLVKFGKAMGTVTGAMIVGYYNPNSFNYSNNSFLYFESGTLMHLASNENKLYIINTKTNDVSIFNSKDLSNKKVIATGNGTFGVFDVRSGNKKQHDTIVLSENSINYFDSNSVLPPKVIKYRRLLLTDFENNLIFSENKNKEVLVYNLNTGKFIEKMNKAYSLEKIF